MGKLTHLNQKGEAEMVDISGKDVSARQAVAGARVLMAPETLQLVQTGTAKKGDVQAAARIAGIMAAKKTSELIPLCHPLALSKVAVAFEIDEAGSAIDIRATATTTDRTGVEMEALTAASVAALTIYDMLKAADRAIRITDIRLLAKSGGKSGDYQAE